MLCALLILAWGTGCASRSGPGGSTRVERPDADARYDVLVAEVTAREGDVEEALEALDRAIAKDPDSAYLSYRASRFAAQLEDVDRAIAYGEAGMALDPDDVEGRRFLGRLYLHERRYNDVERTLRDSDERPLDSESALLLFQMYMERGQLTTALTTARLLLQDDPENLGAYMAVATIFERLREYDQAEEALRAGLEYHPHRFVLYSRLARVRRAAGDRPGEIAVYREVLENEPEHHGTLVSLGEAQIATGDIEGAIETYRVLVEAHPSDVQAIKRLASLEFSVGEPEMAAERFEAALAANPDRPDLAYALGQVRRALGRSDAALDAFARVPAGHPLYTDARMQIATVYEEQGDLEASLAEVESLRAVRSDRTIDFHAASLRARTGDLEGGVAILEAMLVEDPGDEEVLYQIGVLYGISKRT
ncbi:MAG: tetratricopeptide repeat protein, partial [Actinomycetota bacterium]|nr:tetratricopeptide repeat protein [Actinomycetota bacterium]